MKILHLYVFFLLALFTRTLGQSGNDSLNKNKSSPKFRSFHKQLQARTKEQINELKTGALLVRLQTRKLAINALKKSGLNKEADRIERKQKELNIKIVAAFKAEFTFCPTYIFYSDYSQNVMDRQFDKVSFLTDSLRVDSTIKFTKRNFLTAEFGIIEPDTAKHISGGEHMGFDALLIKSDQFIQLRRPFPYYVRTLDLLPTKRNPNQVVKKMNKKLEKFYKENGNQ